MAVTGVCGHRDSSHATVAQRASHRAFCGISALLFAGGAALTAHWCAMMSGMGGMPMPGGWTLSMTWMRMPGATWSGTAASFLGMWVAMMVPMKLPSLVPMLWRYRQGMGTRGAAPGLLTTVVGVAYFVVWSVFGMATFTLGTIIAALEMQQPALARAAPLAVGVVVLSAGLLQFTTWKAQRLVCCRKGLARGDELSADASAAWRYGLRLGFRCAQCCAGLMVVLLSVGLMDLRAMALVAAAITAERLAPSGERVARTLGFVVAGTGVFLIAHAAGLGS